jgi:hypothetical protein
MDVMNNTSLRKSLPFFLLLLLICACTNTASKTEAITDDQSAAIPTPPPAISQTFDNTQGEPDAERIKTYLIDRFLQRDIPLMQEEDKQFQYAAIDLNGDGREEYFVRFQSSYFCGKEGCTMLILNNDLTLINRYTMMQPPVHVSADSKNGWRTIMVQSNGAFREMAYENGKYPEQFSTLPAGKLKPGAQVLFDDKAAPSKTYYFAKSASQTLPKGAVEQRLSVFQRSYNAGPFSFKVNATNSELTPIHISTEGLPKEFKQTFEKAAAVKEAHLLDLNKDGFMELYIVLQETGKSGNLGLLGIASYKNKSAGEIYIKDTQEIREVNSDRVFVENGELRRTFVRNGKTMNFKYVLKAGETSFVLEVVGM